MKELVAASKRNCDLVEPAKKNRITYLVLVVLWYQSMYTALSAYTTTFVVSL